MDVSFVCNVMMSILFISTFIAVFFFTYASQIESEIIVNQTTNIVDSFLESIDVWIPHSEKVYDILQNIQFSDTSADDARVKRKNDTIIKKTIKLFVVIGSIMFLITALLILGFDLDWKPIVLSNLIILACVGLTEFFFLTCIAKNYVSFDPNYIKYVVVSRLEAFRDREKPVNM